MASQDKRAQPPVGNLLDMWDGVANDTRDFLQQTETGFYEAVEAIRKFQVHAGGSHEKI